MYRIEFEGSITLCLNGREAFEALALLGQERLSSLSVTRLRRGASGVFNVEPLSSGIVDKVSVFYPSGKSFEQFISEKKDWRLAAGKLLKVLQKAGLSVTCKNTRGGAREGAGRKLGGKNAPKKEDGPVMVSLPFDSATLECLEFLCGGKRREDKSRYLTKVIRRLYKLKRDEESQSI